MSDKVRVQFDFTKEAYDELTALQRAIGVPTKAETVRHALRLLQWITEEVGSGGEILLRSDGKMQRAIFPFFPNSQNAVPKRQQRHKRAAH